MAAGPRGQADPALARAVRRAVGEEQACPTGSPARMRVKGSGCVPEAMITEPPACVTSRAAASLLRMPPVPSELRLGAGQAEHLVVDLRDQRDDLGRRRRARVGPIEAVDDAQDHQQRRLEQVGRPSRRAGRCRRT